MVGVWASFSMNQVAQTYLLYEITGSAAMLGIIALTGTTPILILSLFGGAIADQLPKKLLIMVSHIGFSVIFSGYAVAVITGYLTPAHPESWWVLLVGSVTMGILVALSMPARGAIIPEIVDRDRLMNAISLNIMGMSFFQMTIPFVAGYVIAEFGYASIFSVMIVLNLMAIIFVWFLPRTAARPSANKNILKDIVEGFKYIFANRTIMLVLMFFVSSILLLNPLQMLMPVFAKDILKVGVEGQGTLMSLMGTGSIVIAFLLASLPSRKRGFTLLASNIVMGVAMATFAFSDKWPLSMAMMIFIGIGRMGADACGSALLQTHTEASLLGRVNSLIMLSFGMGGLGTFFIGILAETISAPWALGGFATLLITVSISAIVFLPRLRKLD